jgi:hypothetical protein
MTLGFLPLLALLIQTAPPQEPGKQTAPKAASAPACVSVSKGGVPQPRKLHDSKPDWAAMRKIRTYGSPLIFDAVITPAGAVTDVRPHHLRGRQRPSPRLEELWRKAIQEWRYEPTIVDGRPVPVCMTVAITIDVM